MHVVRETRPPMGGLDGRGHKHWGRFRFCSRIPFQGVNLSWQDPCAQETRCHRVSAPLFRTRPSARFNPKACSCPAENLGARFCIYSAHPPGCPSFPPARMGPWLAACIIASVPGSPCQKAAQRGPVEILYLGALLIQRTVETIPPQNSLRAAGSPKETPLAPGHQQPGPQGPPAHVGGVAKRRALLALQKDKGHRPSLSRLGVARRIGPKGQTHRRRPPSSQASKASWVCDLGTPVHRRHFFKGRSSRTHPPPTPAPSPTLPTPSFAPFPAPPMEPAARTLGGQNRQGRSRPDVIALRSVGPGPLKAGRLISAHQRRCVSDAPDMPCR